MSTAREELREALCRYTTDTFSYMKKMRQFYVEISTWMSRMEADLISMRNINKWWLALRLRIILRGLEVHGCFLDAVEKLVVTSLYVFKEENHQVFGLPLGFKPEHVKVVIQAARLICPLLLEFKKDPDVLRYQPDKYIQTIQLIFEKFQESGVQNLFRRMSREMVVVFREDLSEEEIQMMLYHINQLDMIRMDPKSCPSFINELSKRKPRMLQSLNDLEKCADQLEKMNKGAKISSVAGSSVGAIGGALSIAGLVLIPFTAGLSLGLTMTGVGLGATSAVNGVVTKATEMGVNRAQQMKAKKLFQKFMLDVQILQDYLELFEVDQTSESESDKRYKDAGDNAGEIFKDWANLGRCLPKVAFTLSRSVRAGLIGLNALFIGLDLYTIFKDSESLAKGSETEASQFIRAQVAFWRPKIELW